jgi:hypothetical protein
MSTDRQLEAEIEDRAQARTAFLLGWAVSQTLGHLRKGARPSPKSSAHPADYAPRLAVSDGVVEKSTDAFVLAAQRIVQFYRELDFEAGDRVSPLTQAINQLPQDVSAWVHGESSKSQSPHELRDLLNAWSLQVWARLGGASADSMRAFTAGMSLADTYWYLRLPTRRPKGSKPAELSEENWRRLLSKYRLDIERSRLQVLAEHLPRYVAAVINRHLEAWRIGTELGYRDGTLVRIKDGKETGVLKPNDEARMQQALGRQAQNWEAMLFGSREATTFLLARDRRLIIVGRLVGLFFVLLGTALFLIAAAAVIAYFLSVTLLPPLLQFLTNAKAGASDWLTVVSFLWTILIAVPVPLVLRAAYQFTRAAQGWLDDQLTIYFIARRTFVPWDKYFKSQLPKDQISKDQIPTEQSPNLQLQKDQTPKDQIPKS